MAIVTTRQPEVKLIGRSPAIVALEAEIDSASRSDAKVLITGETGVGKEVVSRLIHHRSARAAAGLVTLNCAGLPDSLLESDCSDMYAAASRVRTATSRAWLEWRQTARSSSMKSAK